MTDEAFDDWAGYHATLHRMTDAADIAMLQLWREAFDARGYDADELREASMHLATSGEARWRTEHLEAILSRIANRRLSRLRSIQAEEDARHEADECKLCGGGGLLSVPHPASVRFGEWVHPWYSCGVACLCYRGQKWTANNLATIESAKEKQRMTRKGDVPTRLISINEYELQNPAWESQVQHRDIKRETERRARMATAGEDRRRGPLAAIVGEITKAVAS